MNEHLHLLKGKTAGGISAVLWLLMAAAFVIVVLLAFRLAHAEEPSAAHDSWWNPDCKGAAQYVYADCMAGFYHGGLGVVRMTAKQCLKSGEEVYSKCAVPQNESAPEKR